MIGSHRRWLGAITAATLLVTTVQAQERASAAPALRVDFRTTGTPADGRGPTPRLADGGRPSPLTDAEALRKSVRREAANVGRTLPQTTSQQRGRALSPRAKRWIGAGIGAAVGLIVGVMVVEGQEDMPPGTAWLAAGIGAGTGAVIAYSW